MKSAEAMSRVRRKLTGSLAGLCAVLLAGCLPSADFKMAVKVVDEAGRPIPDALVLVGAYVSVEPPLEAPYDIGFSANRGMTSRDGIAHFSRLHGLYEGQRPEDAFYKMLESRQPKKKRRITGVKGGSILVFAPRYGAFHQSFGVRDSPGFKQELTERGMAPQDYTGWFGRSDREWNYETVLIETRDIVKGGAVTITVRKTSNPEHPHVSFQPAVLWETERATSRVTGATVEDKERVYDFFLAQMEYAVAMSTDSFYKEKLDSLRNPQQRKEYTDALRAWGRQEHNHDTNVHEWMTRSALALLPQGYEEVKEHAGDILEGVKAEDAWLRPAKHFYNPFDPETGFEGNETALKWGAIGYPDNPKNDWDWQDARRYYQEGDKRKAYKALGHVLHLLEDLSVPMHTRNIRHVYHLDSEAAFELHFSKLAKTNEGLLAVYGMGAWTPAGGGLKEHFEGLAKLTFGTFVEDRQPVDFDAFYEWEKGKTGKQIKEPNERTLDLMGRRLLPRAIEHSAGLLKGFYDGLHPEQFAQAPGDKTTSGEDGSKAGQQVNSAAASSEKFTRHEIVLKEASGPKPRQKAAPAKPQTSWRFDFEEPPTEDRPLMEGNPLTKRRCIFYRDARLYCWDEPFRGIFPAADDQTAIAYGWGDSFQQLIIAIDKSGRVIEEWESPGSPLVGKAARKGDLFVAIRETGGAVEVVGISLRGELRWIRQFKGAELRGITPEILNITGDGRNVIASFNGSTHVFDRSGKTRVSIPGTSQSKVSPTENWAALCGSEKIVVYEFAAGRAVFETSGLPPGRSFYCEDISPDGEQLLITESSPYDRATKEGRIQRVHVVDIVKRKVSTAKTNLKPSWFQFDDAGHINTKSGEDIRVLEIHE